MDELDTLNGVKLEVPRVSLRALMGESESELFLMEINLLRNLKGWGEFSIQVKIERGDGTIGLHQRSMWFRHAGRNSLALVAAALQEFEDVMDRDG